MRQRKKILFCITKSVWGGAQKYVYELASALPKDTLDVAIVAGGSGPLFEMCAKNRIRTITASHLARDIHFLGELYAFAELLSIFLKEKPDIIHLNSSKVGALGAIAAFSYKLLTLNFTLRTIFTVHGWGFREDRNVLARFAIFTVAWISAFFHTDTILINTSDWQDARTFIPKQKISLIPLAAPSSQFLPREEARSFFASYSNEPITDHTLLIGAIAELTRNKGIPYLIEAVHHLHKDERRSTIKIVIIGEGEERKQLQRQIDQCGLGKTVMLLGFIPDAQRYLTGLDLFVIPSVKEGLPYVLMEAMAAGLATIATKVGGIPDLISHHTNGVLVAPRNPHAISVHLDHLLRQKEKRIALGVSARNTIATKCSHDRMVDETIALYYT